MKPVLSKTETTQTMPEEVRRFREVMCQPQKYPDILLWRKDIEGSTTEMIERIEAYWMKRLDLAKSQERDAIKTRLSYLTRYERSIYKVDHSDGEPLQNMLLEKDVLESLQKEGE